MKAGVTLGKNAVFKWNSEASVARCTANSLTNIAKAGRSEVIKTFSSSPKDMKFCWQFWHEPERYNHLRTPAEMILSSTTYQKTVELLSFISREYFGCAEISPPWVSLYTDGCFQNWHADVPHGPWAFVFSLTETPKTFVGGRTLVLRPDVLDYWPRVGQLGQSTHSEDVLEAYEPSLGQLLVFDPRLPHSVEMVRGVSAPEHGRIVMHGWFTEPRPFIRGDMELEMALQLVDPVLNQWLQQQPEIAYWHGVWVLRLNVTAQGRVTAKTLLSRVMDLEERIPVPLTAQVCRKLLSALAKLKFPKNSGSVELTIPLSFAQN
jgi:hypothetical protein